MSLLSVFGGGLWFIPTALFLGAAWSFYRGYRSSKSNSTTQGGVGQPTLDNTGNVPIWKTSGFLYGSILLVATIVVIIAMASDK